MLPTRIDWELSTLGHPLADLAYTCMLYDIQLPRVGGLLGVDFEATGIPSEARFVARYGELLRQHTRSGGFRGTSDYVNFIDRMAALNMLA